jgi:hypothetical protein
MSAPRSIWCHARLCDRNTNIIGTIKNGRIVIIRRYGEDARGKPWAFVETPDGDPIGWVYHDFIICF